MPLVVAKIKEVPGGIKDSGHLHRLVVRMIQMMMTALPVTAVMIIQMIVMRSCQMTMLKWTGKRK